MAVQSGLCRTESPEDRFSCDGAHMNHMVTKPTELHCVTSEDPDHLNIRVFAVGMKNASICTFIK